MAFPFELIEIMRGAIPDIVESRISPLVLELLMPNPRAA